ncbi:hypothetical protein NL676_010162 [Syzygium grande]|nr:hypothetical protein NL676_010162 [Syzygium grande]
MSLEDWLRIQRLQKAYRCPAGCSEVLVLYALTSTPEPHNSNVHIFLTFLFPFGLRRNGSNAKGYFTWSLLDEFELMDGSIISIQTFEKNKRKPRDRANSAKERFLIEPVGLAGNNRPPPHHFQPSQQPPQAPRLALPPCTSVDSLFTSTGVGSGPHTDGPGPMTLVSRFLNSG